MINFNCPVCNQAGLPNYRTQPTTCPQCNSDLKPYFLLHSISKKQNKKGANNLIILSLIVCCFLLAFFLSKNTREYNRILTQNNQTIQLLRDSINMYKNNLNTVVYTNNNEAESKEITVAYTIKKGNSMQKITRLFYGESFLYKKFEKDKRMQRLYSLRAEQLLNIKLIQNECQS
jgi:LysM repeat protein